VRGVGDNDPVHRFLVPDLASAGGRVMLPRGEAHHLARVLRLVAGDVVVLFDGRGHETLARVAETGRATAAVEVLESRTPLPEPPVAVTLGLAVLKGDQMDAAIRDATMVGAAVIVPFVSAHVAVAERAWRARSLERWERVAVGSAKQCARAVVPAIRPVIRLDELLATPEGALRLLCVEPAQARTAARGTPLPRPVDALVCVGPEGGWTAEELALAERAGCQMLTLGPRTLRAEAAPLVVLSVLWAWWGWE
jgi:16S rRNA (uracil1498-N3)-methyltransferase